MNLGIIHYFKKYLPITDKTPIVTLYEGDTPIVRASRLAEALGIPEVNLFLKLEGLNPTGSFKDRGMTVAVSKALEEGSKAVITASTGNTSASAAAFATRAGINCVVLVPEGNIAMGKLSQAIMYGAKVLSIDGNFDDALQLVKEISEKYPLTMVNSLNPFRLQGQKTGAFEIIDNFEELGVEPPHYQFMPVGNAGNISAYWMGYKEFYDLKKIPYKPKMMGFQAAGAAPIVDGAPVKKPETIATAIRIGNPASWKLAEAARDESGGVIDKVTDVEILDSYNLLARLEGVYCEPASAAGVAGLKKYVAAGKFKPEKGTVIVCIITGNGLKDPERAIAEVKNRPISVKADLKSIVPHLEI